MHLPARSFYITTPIYYVNDRPHIGHCYTTVVADVAARFQRLILGGGADVFFLTGTDEHADKVVTSAAEHGVTPQQWADRNAEEFRKAFAFIGASNDDFIRTTEPRHKDRVIAYVTALLKGGDIYKGEYTGWYDPGQEEYVTETAAREAGHKSVISGKPLVKRTEPCYFFRLSAYQDRLLKLIEPDGIWPFVRPDARRQEVLGRLRRGLNDVPVSRPVTDDPATQWGIRIPGDPAHRLYVWIDALFNYLTAVDTPERRRLWPPAAAKVEDSDPDATWTPEPCAVQLIGKDILWFHAVIWPALLMALRGAGGYEWVGLPTLVFGHGWWISEGQKMSKSLGNFIDLEKLKAYADRYGLDAVRWYLATQGPLAGNDADFSHAKFVEVYNADLANGIGNSTSRVSNMVAKYFDGRIPPNHSIHVMQSAAGGHSEPIMDWGDRIRCLLYDGGAIEALEDFALDRALHQAVALITEVDNYISATRPFSLAKEMDDPQKRKTLEIILSQCTDALRIASLLMYPAMPEKMADLWRRWNCHHLRDPKDANSGFVAPLAELAQWGGPHSLKPGTAISKGDPLFMRADPAEPAP